MRSAEDLHRLSVEALNAGRTARGRSLLAQARERAIEDEVLARIDLTSAYLEAETGDQDVAVRLCDQALARPGISGGTRTAVHAQRGLLMMLAGRASEALDDFAVTIGSSDSDADVLGRSHLNRGNVYLQQNELDRAQSDFEQALSPLNESGLQVEAAMSEHNLGYCRLLRGDLVGALQWMDRARLVLAPLSPVNEATCDQDRAEVLMAAGLIAEGRSALQAAGKAYGSRRLRRRQAEAELALSRTLLLDDPASARSIARSSARRFREAGLDAWSARAEAVTLAADVELGNRGPSLVRRGIDLATELEQQELHWGAVTARLHAARVLIRREDLDGARGQLGHLSVDGRSPLAVRLLARDVRAELAQRQGHRGRALQHLRAGLADLHFWQSSFGSLDLQTNVVGQGRRLGVRALELAADSRKPEVLFEWSERARMLASRVQPVRAPQDESMATDLAELREIAQARAADQPASPDREAELRRRVRERAWHHRGSGEVDDPVSLGELRDALGTDTALVAYVVTGNRVIALVVTDGAATQHDLGERATLVDVLDGLLPDLDMAATDLPDVLAAAVRRELGARLDRLGGLLVTPILEAVGDRRVVLTPSGLLAAVPWPLLAGFNGRPVTVAQSATAWLSRRERPLRVASAGLVAGPRVDRAQDEVLAAAREWHRSDVLIGTAVTAEAVSDLAANVDVLHVAAHGKHSAENPMFSGLELVDGPWYGYDIDQLRAVPDVVLLSACEVGASTVRWGEELIGMTGAWLHAGSRRVVASAAAVNDVAAFDSLVRVHERLAAGADPADALADAVPAFTLDASPVPLVCFG